MTNNNEQIRGNAVLSWKKIIPNNATPTAPIPMNDAYTVPAGKLLRDWLNKSDTGTTRATDTTIGINFEIPADHFIAKGHAISNTSAKRINAHAIFLSIDDHANLLGILPQQISLHKLVDSIQSKIHPDNAR